MDSEINKLEINKVLETVFLPFWGMTALILDGGEIMLYLKTNSPPYTKQKLLDECQFIHEGDEFLPSRIKLFDDLHKYYLEKYEDPRRKTYIGK